MTYKEKYPEAFAELSRMKTLDQIGIEHQTDKASQFSRTWAKPHDYLRRLERFFEPLRDKPIKLLEIGIGSGESAATWLEYFAHPETRVFGVDIVSNSNTWNTPGSMLHPRYTFTQGDQSSKGFWAKFIATHGGDWDVIIDDGSHIGEHIITSFNCLWPHVKSQGIYEIEDLAVAPEAKGWLCSFGHVALSATEDIDSIHFSKELAVLIKK